MPRDADLAFFFHPGSLLPAHGPGDLSGPGESGSPLIPDGRVVGLLLSLNMHTCKGIAISAEMIMREILV